MTPVRDPLGILHRLPGIGKQSLHLLLALDIILTALIAHPVLVRECFSGLDTQKDIMGFHILRISIMYVIGTHQRDIQLF